MGWCLGKEVASAEGQVRMGLAQDKEIPAFGVTSAVYVQAQPPRVDTKDGVALSLSNVTALPSTFGAVQTPSILLSGP